LTNDRLAADEFQAREQRAPAEFRADRAFFPPPQGTTGAMNRIPV
jgi:hypothetical protein